MYKLKELLKNTIPVLVIFSSLLFAGSVSFAFAPKNTQIAPRKEEPVQTVKHEEVSFSPLSLHSPQPKQVLGLTTKVVSTSPVPTSTPKASILPSPSNSSTPAPVQTIVVRNVTEVLTTPSPTSTPTPTPTAEPSPTPTPTLQAVSIEINSPDGKSNFSVELNEGANACDILQKAKDEGKITSLTLDDKYLESFGTLLVAEMNSFSSGWVFTVNGESPMGCSLSFPKENDIIVWSYVTF